MQQLAKFNIVSFGRHNPRPFNTWAKEFFPGVNYLPNTAHYFLKVLQDKEKLSKYFTQNIDGLERVHAESFPEEEARALQRA